MTTEARPTSKREEISVRWWLILSLQAGMLLVLLGASWLFSLVQDVSWIVCGVLALGLLLASALLLPTMLRGGRHRDAS